MKIKVMSYNTQHCLNYLTQKIDYDLFVKTIQTCGADIVGLQEMRDKGEREDFEPQAKILAEKLGYYYYFAKAIDHRGANPYGNALLSRYPILEATTVLIPDPEIKKEGAYYESRCVLIAKINAGEKSLKVVNTHFGLNEDEQQNAVKTVLSLVGEDSVLMGDFNLLPDSEIIIPIRKVMTDCADKIEGSQFTFPSDNSTSKIDYIFTSKNIGVVSAQILGVITSDHRPHLATIEI